MTVTVTPTATRHRLAAVGTIIGILAFLGVSAVGGGVAMVLDIGAPTTPWPSRSTPPSNAKPCKTDARSPTNAKPD